MKKMSNFFKSIYIILFSILILSCNKDDQPIKTQPANTIKSTDNEITSFSFETANNSSAGLTGDVNATINHTAKTITFDPFPRTVDLTELKRATFSISQGATVTVGGAIQTSGTSINNFVTGTISYIVTAEDGTTTSIYTVQKLTSRFFLIPNPDFRAELKLIIPSAFKGEFLDTESADVKTLTTMDVAGSDATSLEGIQYFTALEKLICGESKIASLDLSKNDKLKHLNCSYNKLTTLNLSKNDKLEYLDCSSNKLTSLDVSKNTALTSLDCGNNPFTTTLDVSKNIALNSLSCSGNQLTTLDVSKNFALNSLVCSRNQLTTLNLSKNTTLTILNCNSNQLDELDVNKNTQLTYLNIHNNKITLLDVSKNIALTNLDCERNLLTSLDLNKNTQLTDLNCKKNKLTDLNIRSIKSIKFYQITPGPGGNRQSRDAISIGACFNGENPIITLRINENIKDHDKIKSIKTKCGNAITITTYNDNGNVVCANYDPRFKICR